MKPRHKQESLADNGPADTDSSVEATNAEGKGRGSAGSRAVGGVRWSLLAVLTRQGFQILCAIIIARILGPASYGIVSVASIYIVFITLLLDQGLSSALVQRPELNRRTPGAVATLNLMMAFTIGAATWFIAPMIAGFFRIPDLALVLQILALAVPIKALGITPRAMLSRGLEFRGIAISDISGAAVGALMGIGAAVLGAGYFSVLYQVIATDLVVGVILLICARGPMPNHHLKEIRPLLAFSLGVFATNGLAYFSRNIDNILVGRFLGATSLSLYSMAYRILVIPVQMIGQTVNRVMFPAFSRIAGNPAQVAENLRISMQVLSMVVIPAMAFVACAAPPLVFLVLGAEWAGAAPLISVLAIGGARETVFYITPSLMKGMGRAGLNLRYEIFATTLQVGAIVVGLQFGLFWVAAGYTAAGFLLVPVLLLIQSRLCGATVREQLGILWPPVHASLWGSAAYLLIARLSLHPLAEILLGFSAFLSMALVIAIVFHRSNLRLFMRRAKLFVRPRSNNRKSVVAMEALSTNDSPAP